jgi:hypothetical protein
MEYWVDLRFGLEVVAKRMIPAGNQTPVIDPVPNHYMTEPSQLSVVAL